MWHLVLGIAIGVITCKYIFPILDMLLELLNFQITKICTSIQIDTNLMSVDYQEIADQGNQMSPVIGFHSGSDAEEDYYEDDEEEDVKQKKLIGFIK